MENNTTFASLNLDPNISKALEACGYTKMTPIQASSIPEILLGKDIVASAPTGTGKTAAFVLPALHRLSLSPSTNKPRILILTPTRELAAQITIAAGKYGKFMRFNIVSLVGGMPYRQQLRDLSRAVDIVVATPGRLMDHMENGKVDLSNIEMLILDEADRMLDMGFIDDVKHISKMTPESRQTLLFSATVDSKLSTVIRHLLKNPIRVDMSEAVLSPLQIKQELYLADNMQHKNRLLQHFLDNGNIFKAIIFSATKINADNLANELCNQGYAAAALHGDLKQNVRNRTVEQLRRGKIQFLVATDIAARGIDISDVTHVFNYDLPKFSEDYVHRIGRTGRAGKSGIAISFGLPMDGRHLQKIERYIGKRLQIETIAGLEPTKRMNMNGGGSSEKSGRGYKGKGGGYKSDSYSKSAKPSYRGKSDDKPFRARSNDDSKPFRARSSEDKPFRARTNDDSKPFRARSSEDKPFRARSNDDSRPFRARSSEDKPFRARSNDDSRPFRARSSEDKPFRARSNDDSRPFRARSSEDKPFRARSNDDSRPFRARSSEDKPFRARSNDDSRPFRARSSEDKPFRARSNDDSRPFRARSSEDKPFRARSNDDSGPFRARSSEDKPFRARSNDDRPTRARSGDDKPFRARSNDDKPFRAKPAGDKPFRARSNDDKPFRARSSAASTPNARLKSKTGGERAKSRRDD
jgi:superfamily II DNA/RNA helicase